MPRIIVSVSNDLVTDQRVRKVCETLQEMGYEILLIGRKLPNSLPIERPYPVHRMKLFFTHKFWFYAELNIRLFFKLLFVKKDILWANDLDTLLSNFLISKIFRKKLVYDSHELFTEVPELIHRPRIQKVWLTIERFIFPQLKNVITVNEAIAKIYEEKYHISVEVIRNIAPKLVVKKPDETWLKAVKGNQKMLILQGSGINRDRGAEEAVLMMQFLEDTVLYIIGSGDVFKDLEVLIQQNKLEKKVKLLTRLPYHELLQYTQIADLGLSLDKGTNLNYQYSLPNKIFDYIQCQIPIMASDRKVVADLVQTENIGFVFTQHEPKKMAMQVKEALEHEENYLQWKQNLRKASKKYTWKNESTLLKNFVNTIK